MSAYFLDSSAFAKRYVNEIGTTWIIELFKPSKGHRFYVSRITLVEVIAALTRRAGSNSMALDSAVKSISRFRRIFRFNLRTVEISESLIESAALLAEKHALRGYDAVQLASALSANQARLSAGALPLIFVSADNELNQAAVAEGFYTENPNSYP